MFELFGFGFIKCVIKLVHRSGYCRHLICWCDAHAWKKNCSIYYQCVVCYVVNRKMNYPAAKYSNEHFLKCVLSCTPILFCLQNIQISNHTPYHWLRSYTKYNWWNCGGVLETWFVVRVINTLSGIKIWN